MAHQYYRVLDSASVFTSHIRALHEEIRDKIMKNNVDYKSSADLHYRLRTFNIGHNMMVCLRPEQFPSWAVKKLHAWSVGPFQIFKRINSNAYAVDLPSDFCISYTFNVEHLVPYRGTFDTFSDPFMDEPTHDLLSEAPTTSTSSKIIPCSKNIDSILND